jgi:hypothetical protein
MPKRSASQMSPISAAARSSVPAPRRCMKKSAMSSAFAHEMPRLIAVFHGPKGI